MWVQGLFLSQPCDYRAAFGLALLKWLKNSPSRHILKNIKTHPDYDLDLLLSQKSVWNSGEKKAWSTSSPSLRNSGSVNRGPCVCAWFTLGWAAKRWGWFALDETRERFSHNVSRVRGQTKTEDVFKRRFFTLLVVFCIWRAADVNILQTLIWLLITMVTAQGLKPLVSRSFFMFLIYLFRIF